MKHYKDYFWDEGRPTGINALDGHDDTSITSYKLVSDPYHKWISIEKYKGKDFDGIVYDSKIFDFRNLKPINHTAWQKEPLGISEETSIIRDQDDRIILFEEYSFEGTRCRVCRARSVHGIPISTQMIYYKELGDNINGVALFDNNDHIVMYKLYDIDSESGQFAEVIEEKWNMKNQDFKQWQRSPSKKSI